MFMFKVGSHENHWILHFQRLFAHLTQVSFYKLKKKNKSISLEPVETISLYYSKVITKLGFLLNVAEFCP